MKYPWVAYSPSKPKEVGLGYKSKDEALVHANDMNHYVDRYDFDPLWNKNFWTERPKYWVVEEV